MKTRMVFILMGMAIHAGGAGAAETDGLPAMGAEETVADEMSRGFYSRINILAYGIVQSPRDSTVNPDNALNVPRYEAVLNPRADFNLEFRRWEFGLKPRAEFGWTKWTSGPRKGDTDSDDDFFINEGYLRYRPTDELLLSFGRENLQWGPSVILSSSNPFTQDNGRNNPRVEVPGITYARAVWIPNETWTLSAIANTSAGRSDEQDGVVSGASAVPDVPGLEKKFERAYALKLDWTGPDSYFSVIPSYRETDQYRLGFFGGWNVSDALILYGEGSVAEDDDPVVQVGASYTLESGPTLAAEYLRNENGCTGKSMAACFLGGEVSSRDVLFRRDYLMLQYTDSELVDDLTFNLRLIRNLNDHSNRFIGIFEYEVGDHVQLYLIGNRFTGDKDSEFGSLLRYSLFFGMGYTF